MNRVRGLSLAICVCSAFLSSNSLSQPAPANNQARATQVRIDRIDSDVSVPQTGHIRAFQIKSPDDFSPGQLADGFIGDYVLENDTLRAVISRPGKKRISSARGGNLIDLLHRKVPVDYMNYLEPVADLELPASKVVYTDVSDPVVLGTSASLVVKGFVTEEGENDTTATESADVSTGIDVTTTYTVGKNDNFILITTSFTNSTTQPVSLLPGDVADWGHAGTFLEEQGAVSDAVDATRNYIIAAADDYSVGYITSGTEPMHGVHTSRMSVIRAYGQGPIQNVSPGAKTEHPAAPAIPPAATETSYHPPVAPAPAETSFSTSPAYAPPAQTETPYQQPSVQPQVGVNALDDNYLGGGDVPEHAAAEAGDSASATTVSNTDSTTSSRLTLKPGESFTYSRYLVVSDLDYSRITSFAFREKRIATGSIAGAVLENGSDKLLPGVEVLISGGPNWNGQSSAPAYTKVTTRGDGTYGLRLPFGNYIIGTMKAGRSPVGETPSLTLSQGSMTQVVPLVMSRESIVKIAIAQADTETSIPLPCKVTFTNKPGTPAPYFGFGPDVTRGSRNVYFLPYGAALIPLSPGRYQVTISRGIEYDVINGDMTLLPGQNSEIIRTLPRVLGPYMKDMIAFDSGIMTTASAVSLINPQDAVIMAACEGVPVIISGDYNKATDLQPVVNALGLQEQVRAFRGIKFLVEKNGSAAEILAYPVPQSMVSKIEAFRERTNSLPDIFLADLRKEFPGILIQIDRPLDPERGYLNQFPFDQIKFRFDPNLIPPPDFDIIQLVEGKRVGTFRILARMYHDLLVRRLSGKTAFAPLAGLGNSGSRLPHGEEIGYPRTYIQSLNTSVNSITEDDIVSAIRGHHYIVSNGPIPLLKGQDDATAEFKYDLGDIMDASTSQTATSRIQVVAAPWVSLSGIDIKLGGKVTEKTEVMPSDKVLRYPVQQDPITMQRVQYPTSDSIIDALAYGVRRALDPIVPPAAPDFGGLVYPVGWTSEIFLDKDGDGRIQMPAPEDEPE